MAKVYRARAGYTLHSSVDAYGRRYGFAEERFVVRNRVNPDRNTIIEEALLASVDTNDSASVAGSVLADGQPHPYYDGTAPDRPLALVNGRGVVQEVNSSEAVIFIRWQTQYTATGSGPGAITNGATKRSEVTYKDIPVYRLVGDSSAGLWQQSVKRRPVTISRYYLQYTSDDLPDLYSLQKDENKLSTPGFLQPLSGPGERKVLYQGASVTPFQAQFIVTEIFLDISDLKELTTDDLGDPNFIAVPEIKGLGDWSIHFAENDGHPIYTVQEPEDLFEEIPPNLRWSK